MLDSSIDAPVSIVAEFQLGKESKKGIIHNVTQSESPYPFCFPGNGRKLKRNTKANSVPIASNAKTLKEGKAVSGASLRTKNVMFP